MSSNRKPSNRYRLARSSLSKTLALYSSPIVRTLTSNGQPYFLNTRTISGCASLVEMYNVFSDSSAGEINCFANNSAPEPVSVKATMVKPRGTPPCISLSNFGTPKEPTCPKNSSSSSSNLMFFRMRYPLSE